MMQSKLTYTLAFQIHKGMVRDGNEDDFLINPDLVQDSWTWTNDPAEIQPGGLGALFVVADGMGGLNAGEVASRLAVESMKEVFADFRAGWKEGVAFDPKDLLLNGIRAAAKRIANFPKEDPTAEGLGTTMTAGWLLGSKLHLAWVGDSRAYALHSDGSLEQLNKDHSYVQELVDTGELTEEQAFYHPQKNIITRCLSDGESKNYPDYRHYDLQAGDRLLFCSDGLNTMIDNPGIQRIMQEEPTTLGCARKLVDEANAAGGHDNITVILADIVNADGSLLRAIPQKGRKFKMIYVLLPLLLLMAGATIGYFYAKKDGEKPGSPEKIVLPAKQLQRDSTRNASELDSTGQHQEDASNKIEQRKKASKPKKEDEPSDRNQFDADNSQLLIEETDDSQESNDSTSVQENTRYYLVISVLKKPNMEDELNKDPDWNGQNIQSIYDMEKGDYKYYIGVYERRIDAFRARKKWLDKLGYRKDALWVHVQ